MKEFGEKDRPARVLVLRGGAIGDFVVTLPVLQWLRLTGPGAVIDLACHPRVAPLAHGLVSQWRDIDSAVFLPLHNDAAMEGHAVVDFLGNYDFVLSFLGSRTKPAGRLRELIEDRAFCLDPVPGSNSTHVTAFFFEQIALAGFPAPSIEEAGHILPVIDVDSDRRREAAALLGSLGLKPDQALIAVHPGSGSPGKNAPAGVLAEACTWLVDAFEYLAVVLVKGEADEAAVEALQDQLRARLPVIETPDLGVLAAALGECALFVGHDSGVSHIAAAVATPTVAIFVSSDPAVWMPRGPRVACAEPTVASIRAAAVSLARR